MSRLKVTLCVTFLTLSPTPLITADFTPPFLDHSVYHYTDLITAILLHCKFLEGSAHDSILTCPPSTPEVPRVQIPKHTVSRLRPLIHPVLAFPFDTLRAIWAAR